MPKIHLEHPHSLELSEVRKRMERSLEELSSKYDVKTTWKDDRNVDLKRSGLKGFAKIEDDSVVVELDLSFVLAPMKGKIEQRLKDKLAKELS
jgi:putative polyhydroxyalkanoate system protein